MSKSPSLRRIQADIRELALDPSDRYHAAPLENDMFEWHFTIRGAEGTDFEGGVYHGRILLPPEYPFKPPHIIFLTPSGRFETNTKVCLSFSAFHPELWQPAWGIRLILEALISFLPTPADGAIGALDWTKDERQRLAKLSQSYCCSQCGKCQDLLPKVKDNNDNAAGGRNVTTKSRFAKEIEELQRLQQLAERKVKPEDAVAPMGTVEQATEQEQQQPASEGEEEAKAHAQEPNSSLPVAVPNTTTAMTATTHNRSDNDVFQDDKPTQAPNHDSEAVTPTNLANPTPPRMTTTPTTTTNVVEENHMADLEPPHVDHSWIYDPALNVMIVVLAAICYLLLQKYQDLMGELNELRQLSDLGKK